MKIELIDKVTIRFLIVGVINTLVGSGVMFLLYNFFSISYWIASASNYVIGSIVSYFLNKIFTFQNKEKSINQIIRFIINIVVCYVIAYGIAKPITISMLKNVSVVIQDNISMLIGMCLFVVLNYIGQRYFVFRKANNEAL